MSFDKNSQKLMDCPNKKQKIIHDVMQLKILSKYFKKIINGDKTFEIRKRDKNFKEGDLLELREWDGLYFTGRSCLVSISYILTDEQFEGITHGYCVMSINFISNAI